MKKNYNKEAKRFFKSFSLKDKSDVRELKNQISVIKYDVQVKNLDEYQYREWQAQKKLVPKYEAKIAKVEKRKKF